MIELIHGDCMEGMKDYPDNYFQLAIVDPPYGKNADNDKKGNFVMTKHVSKNWDKEPPPPEYFDLLIQKSKNQIILGANHFIDNFPFMCNSSCWVIWDKFNPLPGKFSDCEMAWTSYNKPTRIYRQAWIGFGRHLKEKNKSIHPTQKPVALCKWLLKNYAKEGDKILDTHGGSMSTAIACYDMDYDLTLYELDKDYFEAGKKRFENHKKQLAIRF